ncbi:MAG TPA: Spo0E family sporulation regulatory protein-aspartic acid phosphatase [Clostridiales bacterium]|nr:Spo0E family sporulation regulatory protein-aspartic acid phosphatase [Clostridiales bacterium]
MIHDRIYLGENFVADDEMIKMSQDLDKLIVEYMCAQGKSSCENS